MNEMRIGQAVPRGEDIRLLQGKGRYADDVNFLNQARAHVLRSPHAHAEIRGVNLDKALAAPGVLAVLTGTELAERGLGSQRPGFPAKRADGSPGFITPQPLLAQGRVRFVGEPVAFVVAESVNQAKDAAELIEVDYEILTPVITVDGALAPGALAVWEDNPGNEAYTHQVGNAEAVEEAIKNAKHVIRHRVLVSRVTANAIETRGCIAQYDDFEDR